MQVRLISQTTPAEYLVEQKCLTLADIVVYCARISNPDNQLNFDTTENLIKYLIKHKHWSPFEMVNLCFEVETTRDVARQIIRHRSFAFQEFSQRYANPSKSLGFDVRECRLQDPKNRQSSTWCTDEELNDWWQDSQEYIIDVCVDIYNQGIRRGVAKEVARSVLPEGLMKSKLYMNGTLRSWIHYCEVRTDEGTQKEHREIAKAIYEQLVKVFPYIKG